MEQTPHTFADFELLLDIDSLSMHMLLWGLEYPTMYQPESHKIVQKSLDMSHYWSTGQHTCSVAYLQIVCYEKDLTHTHTHTSVITIGKNGRYSALGISWKGPQNCLATYLNTKIIAFRYFVTFVVDRTAHKWIHVNSLYNLFSISNCPAASS